MTYISGHERAPHALLSIVLHGAGTVGASRRPGRRSLWSAIQRANGGGTAEDLIHEHQALDRSDPLDELGRDHHALGGAPTISNVFSLTCVLAPTFEQQWVSSKVGSVDRRI